MINHQDNANQTYGISREHARRYPCPKCNAAAGQPCLRVSGGARKANHIERMLAAANKASNRGSAEALSPTALAFVDGYLLSWKPRPSAARLTPQEREVGARALQPMVYKRSTLESWHKNGVSLEETAARHNQPLRVIARRYVEAVWELAANATPFLETCCQSCLGQMPDVIFDATLRCPACLALVRDYDKPIPNALEVEELKASCAVLRTTWTAPMVEIEAGHEKRLKLWNYLIESFARPGERHPYAEDARTKENEAWAFIKSYQAKYGY